MATPPPPKPWRAAAGAGETAVKSTPVADGSAVKPWDKPGAGQTPSGARTSERATRREGEGEGEGERGETDDDDDDDVRAIAPVATVNNPTGTTATPESRAWETTNRGTSHGASPSGYAGTTYGGAPYGGNSMYGGYRGGAYGNSMYGGGYGGYGGGMYGGGMYGGGYGGGMYGGYGGGMYGGHGGGMYGGGMYGQPPMGPYGPGGPPPGAPPLTGWQALMHSLSSVVHLFGKISFLVDENTQALHFFIMSLLQLLDRGGHLYGEMSRILLKAMGYPVPPRPPQQFGPPGGPGGFDNRGAPGAASFGDAWGSGD
jgi:peroxin-13